MVETQGNWIGPLPAKEGNVGFFYGVLMHPGILQRLIGGDGKHLEIASAVLLDHTRHSVQAADYPAVVPSTVSQEINTSTLTREERSVKGVIVRGLTYKDLAFLDAFEGSEYYRTQVASYAITPFQKFAGMSASEILSESTPLPAEKDLPKPVMADIYLWAAPSSRLVPAPWSFETFVKEKIPRWVGQIGKENYDEVDRRRESVNRNRTIGDIPDGKGSKIAGNKVEKEGSTATQRPKSYLDYLRKFTPVVATPRSFVLLFAVVTVLAVFAF